MADERLRELERTWRAQRTPGDELALVQHRARVGAIPPATLELVAAMGLPSARRALGVEPAEPLPDEPRAWVKALIAAEPRCGLRVAIAALRHALPLWEKLPERCERHGAIGCEQKLCRLDLRPRRAVELAEAVALG